MFFVYFDESPPVAGEKGDSFLFWPFSTAPGGLSKRALSPAGRSASLPPEYRQLAEKLPAAYCRPMEAALPRGPRLIFLGRNESALRQGFAAARQNTCTAHRAVPPPGGSLKVGDQPSRPVSQFAAGIYTIGKKMAGSILPTLILLLPRPSMLMAMATMRVPPTALISVMTASPR